MQLCAYCQQPIPAEKVRRGTKYCRRQCRQLAYYDRKVNRPVRGDHALCSRCNERFTVDHPSRRLCLTCRLTRKAPTKAAQPVKEEVCEQCHAVFRDTPIRAPHRRKRFCTRHCKATARLQMLSTANAAKRAAEDRRCSHCGAALPPGARWGTKYCPEKPCQALAERIRKRPRGH